MIFLVYIVISLFCVSNTYGMEKEKKKIKQPDQVKLEKTIQGISHIGEKPAKVNSTIDYGSLYLATKDPISRYTYLETLKENQKTGLPLVIVLLETLSDIETNIFQAFEAYSYLSAQKVNLSDVLSGEGNLPALSSFKNPVSNKQLVSYPLVFVLWPVQKKAGYLGQLSSDMSDESGQQLEQYLSIYQPYEHISSEDIQRKLSSISNQLHFYGKIQRTIEPYPKKSRQQQRSIFRFLKIMLNIPKKFISPQNLILFQASITDTFIQLLYEANHMQEQQIQAVKELMLKNKDKIYPSSLIDLAYLLSTQPQLQDEALKILNEISDEGTQTVKYILAKIRIFLQKQDFDQVESWLAKYGPLDPELKKIIQLYIDAKKGKNPSAAIESLKAMLDEKKTDDDEDEESRLKAALYLVEIYLSLGEKDEAKKILETIIKKNIQYLDPYLFYRAQKMWQETH